MINRCYGGKTKAYEDKFVCVEWLTFSNFKGWMETQDWQGKELDKDLLLHGNKVYSQECCVFVDQEVNSFILDNANVRGLYPIGVSRDKRSGKFYAAVGVKQKSKYLGSFDSPEQAHLVWKREKFKLAVSLAEKQVDPRVKEALIQRYKLTEEETNYGF